MTHFSPLGSSMPSHDGFKNFQPGSKGPQGKPHQHHQKIQDQVEQAIWNELHHTFKFGAMRVLESHLTDQFTKRV